MKKQYTTPMAQSLMIDSASFLETSGELGDAYGADVFGDSYGEDFK